MVSAEGKGQESALGFASRRAGWLNASQTRKIDVLVQPSRAEKGHGAKYKVEKKYFTD